MIQQLFLVVGGELKELGKTEFRNPDKLHVVGVFTDQAEARRHWRGAAQQTVDNALMRYFVVPLDLASAVGNNAAYAQYSPER